MKKRLAIGMTMVLVLAFGVVTFAETVEVPQWYKDMVQWRQERLEEAVEDGLITEEEAEWRQEHWEEMDEFRREKGFDYGMGAGYGPCHGERGFMGGRRGGFGGRSEGASGSRGMFRGMF
ncbi:Protein of unknown function [Tindallia magadiensis]|uniref:DUF2680 domain-containing protein n=1 Tax=Tindallia magadiensis TaxID=69895 RepID=A0A1I3DCG9_9FIRM|nr:hypothetical protein [Tindallia magadiensis]SFH84269.1 Protein of unknown function [Tindallia magadiensis]